VLGLSIAVRAARSGAYVSVFDPRPLADNASGVAAGMLSPGLEAALDPDEAELALLAEGYRAWPKFAADLGLDPLPSLQAGALYVDAPGRLELIAQRLAASGIGAERIGGDAARALQPALGVQAHGALHIVQDGRIDPVETLRQLAGRLQAAGGMIVAAPCAGPPAGFDAVVLAAGYEARAWIDRVPELESLRPIKGHVLHFAGGPSDGATLRGPAGYAAPQPRGVVFGATMEAGRVDLEVDPKAAARLHAAALELLPELENLPYAARTGVRAATRSGRPLVGPAESGVHLAVGARRNGWLLAPLIAAATLEQLAGGAGRPEFSLKQQASD
jgi:glycine oxidase